MDITIRETGDVKILSIIDPRSGTNWIADLIGNAGATGDGQFVDDGNGGYIADQGTYDWWEQYIYDSNATDDEAKALASELGISYGDVMDCIAHETSNDYEDHRNTALRVMQALRDEHAK